MTIQDILDQLSKPKELNDVSVRDLAEKLAHIFTRVSNSDIRNFHMEWDKTKSYEEYISAVCERITTCIKNELSDIGRLVREIEGLKPLTLNTEI